MCVIMKTLKTVCDETDPQDQKTLLLAQIVEDRFTAIHTSLESLRKDVEKLMTIVTDTIEYRDQCPVYNEKEIVKVVMMLLKYPKMTALMVLGVSSLVGMGLQDLILQIVKLFIK